MNWTILWSDGPIDNPDNGELVVEADTVVQAISEAEIKHRLPAASIDGIIRTDIWEDL